jgi:tetratricopeptide (TPR) repeat protein
MKCNDVLLFEYLTGSLSREKAEETSAHLEECRDCRERFKIMVALDNPQIQVSKKRPGKFIPAGKTLLLAAAGLLLAIAVSILYSSLPVRDNFIAARELATSQPYPLVMLTTRSSIDTDLMKGLLLYQENSYLEALAELKKHENNHDALFFSAVSLYMLDEPARAGELFKRVAAISEKWETAADWYRSQSLLKLGEKDEALSVLKEISKTENQYKQEALELIRIIAKK